MSELNLSQWNEFIQSHPEAHLLQSGMWGELKADFRWKPIRIQTGEAGSQILFRTIPGGYTIGYIPRGPVGKDWSAIWHEIDSLCLSQNAIFLKVEPDIWEGGANQIKGWLPEKFVSSKSIQPLRTIVVDLKDDEDTLLRRMKQKTRYNIRLAEKKEIEIRETNDIGEFFKIMTVTGQRDGFGIHSEEYFGKAYKVFEPSKSVALLMAYYQKNPLAGLLTYKLGKRAWYLYGASNEEERNRMPTYLLQWRAMQWAKAQNCTEYDLWGIPDYDEETLESQFETKSSGLWGVYRFKRGFGGQIKRAMPAFDIIYRPTLYRLYQWVSHFRSPGEGA
jgi:peptidoglycan pentaglycine glycine transferase (the first glycine)